MKVTMEGDPQEIMVFLARLATEQADITKPVAELPKPEPASTSMTKERVFQFIAAFPGSNTTQVREALPDMSPGSIRARIYDLVMEGRIERRGKLRRNSIYYAKGAAPQDDEQQDDRPAIVLPERTEETVAPAANLKQQILSLLEQRGPQRAAQLRARIVGTMSANTLYARLGELHRDGRIGRVPDVTGTFIYRYLPQTTTA
jgi:hypothetical protein